MRYKHGARNEAGEGLNQEWRNRLSSAITRNANHHARRQRFIHSAGPSEIDAAISDALRRAAPLNRFTQTAAAASRPASKIMAVRVN